MIKGILFLLTFSFISQLIADPRLPALIVVEKELLYLTDELKKAPESKELKQKIRAHMLLEQYVAREGLTNYANELTQNYHTEKLKRESRDCLIWKAIDFDLRYNSKTHVWKEVLVNSKSTYKDALKINDVLAGKIRTCLKSMNVDFKWVGKPYIYKKYETKARIIAQNGLNLLKVMKKQSPKRR
jgi:hypothetical protein